MLHEIKPRDFDPEFESVGCFVEHNGEILLLLRQDSKPEGNTWGMPAGKVKKEKGEKPEEAAGREVEEETGIKVPRSQISLFRTVYVRYPDYDFVYHICHVGLEKRSKVQINPAEHQDAQWKSPEEALNMPVIQDLDACI
jgi:8-oxo-dGTP pyrophosphatase MutT (NUDIX family)